MSEPTSNATLAELCIVACSEAFRDNGEIVATGVGPVPRLAAGLARLSHSPELMMTDGEAYLVEQPVPIGPRAYDDRKPAGHLPFSRFFDAAVWTGRRHAMVTPTQLDRFGQINLSYMGGTYRQPKTQMLGVRGFPGNTIHHANSFFFPAHGPRVFVPGEVDMISGVGYNPAKRQAGGNFRDVNLRLIVTNLCVMDFGGT
ncbi:MAG: ketoacid CoA transferase, partial [Sphingomonadales bacterium]|nr:ketoacid CoA transferase [Sphingomonadales bacterium]